MSEVMETEAAMSSFSHIEVPQVEEEGRDKDAKKQETVYFSPSLSSARVAAMQATSLSSARVAAVPATWSRSPNDIPLLVQLPSGAIYSTIPSTSSRQIVFTSRDISKRRAPGNGLRQFAVSVLQKVEKKGRTTYNEVADELVNEMALDCTSQRGPKCEEKNIRRRVYDALNVLLAIKIIHKVGKSICWTGMPASMQEQCNKLEKDRLEHQKRIIRKKKELKELTVQLVAFKSLIARNKAEYMTSLTQAVKSDADADEDVKLKLPFILVNTSKETVIDCWLSSDRRAYMFNFDHQFEIHDDLEVLRRMGMTYGLERGPLSTQDLGTVLDVMPTAVHRIITELVSESVRATSESQPTSVCSERSSTVPVRADAITSATDVKPPTENSDELVADSDDGDDDGDGDNDDEMMDVDASDAHCDAATQQTRDDDDKATTTTATTDSSSPSLLPEVVELSNVDPELSLSADDWLTSLLRYEDEDESINCSNSNS